MAHRRDEVMAPADRPLGELLGELTRNLGLLIRQEIELAKTEIAQKAKHIGKDAIAIGVGAAVAYAGFLGIVAALVLLVVRMGAAPWVAALIVGAVFAFIGFLLIQRAGKDVAETDLTPRRTAETMKDNVQWVKEQVT